MTSLWRMVGMLRRPVRSGHVSRYFAASQIEAGLHRCFCGVGQNAIDKARGFRIGMSLVLPAIDDMDDFVPGNFQQIADQPAMAVLPGLLGAHDRTAL